MFKTIAENIKNTIDPGLNYFIFMFFRVVWRFLKMPYRLEDINVHGIIFLGLSSLFEFILLCALRQINKSQILKLQDHLTIQEKGRKGSA